MCDKILSLIKFLCLAISALAVAALYYFMRPWRDYGKKPKGLPGTGFSVQSLISGGAQRVYGLYVPPGIDKEKSIPVVISLVGFGANPAFQRHVSRWDRVADKHHFLVAYPQGSSFPLRFNAGPVYKIPETDDVQLIRDLITEIGKFYEIDRKRVYVNGMSGGAHMTDRIAHELADKVAAVGMVSGSYLEFPGGSKPQRAMPVIAFHGTADPFGGYRGRREDSPVLLGIMKLINLAPGKVIEMPAFQEWAAGWARRNGCDLAAAQWETKGDIRHLRYPNNINNCDVEIYAIEGGGHTWPGGSPTFIGKTTHSINASEVMWAFFVRHPLVLDYLN